MMFPEQIRIAESEYGDMDIEQLELRRNEIEKIPFKGYPLNSRTIEERNKCISAVLEVVELEKLRFRRGEKPRPRSDVANDYLQAWRQASNKTTQGNKRIRSNEGDHDDDEDFVLKIHKKPRTKRYRTDDFVVKIHKKARTKRSSTIAAPPPPPPVAVVAPPPVVAPPLAAVAAPQPAVVAAPLPAAVAALPLAGLAPIQGAAPAPQGRRMPPMLEQLITQYNGTDLMWVTEKKLEISDINPNEGRFLFPPCETLESYLTHTEKNKTVVSKGNKEGLSVMVIDSEGGTSYIQFKFWVSVNKYVLIGKHWKAMVTRLKFEGRVHKIHIWCFRLPAESGSNLCFAIEKT